MISADTGATANMPQNVIIKPYPPTPEGMPEDINDGIGGIDNQMNDDSPKTKNIQPGKY